MRFSITKGSPVQSASDLLRAYGLRVTPQRLMLVEIARDMPGHFTAESVFQRVQMTYPSVSVVSVYRGLETLRQLGLVTRTHLGDNADLYEWTRNHRHHHLICTSCGGQLDLPDRIVDDLRSRLAADYGFSARIDHLALFGVCAECAANDRRLTESNRS